MVDSEDNTVTCKNRDEITPEDFYGVSALWIENSEGEILLARRSSDKRRDAGKWGPAVAGTVAEGESYEENIRREAREELGLKDVNFKDGPKVRIMEKQNHFVKWFRFKLDRSAGKFEIQDEEVQEVKWFSKGELKKLVENNPEKFIYTMDRWVDLLIE
ncbi:MAG: NUDIX domain-containing protein [Candidatus Aenigmatarchaeota archaeon]